jgi:hypothetical protein
MADGAGRPGVDEAFIDQIIRVSLAGFLVIAFIAIVIIVLTVLL